MAKRYMNTLIFATLAGLSLMAYAEPESATREECRQLVAAQKYTDKVLRLAHTLDIDDRKDITKLINSCDRKLGSNMFAAEYRLHREFYNDLPGAVLNWRQEHGLEEFDDTPVGQLLKAFY